MSLKRRFCAVGKPSVFAKLEIGRKKNIYFSECRKREVKINSDCYFLVFILCICIVLILLKYIFSFDITNIFLLFRKLVTSQQFSSNYVCQPRIFSASESFLFISSSGFLCFCHRVCSRTRKPQKVLVSKFFEILRLSVILSTFPSILCAQGRTHTKQYPMLSMRTYH